MYRAYDNSRTQDKIRSKLTNVRPKSSISGQMLMHFSSLFYNVRTFLISPDVLNTHTHTHTHMQTYVRTCTCVHTYAHTDIRTHVRTYTHTYVLAYTPTDNHVLAYTHTHTHTHTHTQTHIHTQRHTHTHIHTHTRTLYIVHVLVQKLYRKVRTYFIAQNTGDLHCMYTYIRRHVCTYMYMYACTTLTLPTYTCGQ